MRRDEFPIIDKYVKNEINTVLDKIRDEIRNEQNMDYKCHRKVYDNCLRIIGKYKADTRGEEV